MRLPGIEDGGGGAAGHASVSSSPSRRRRRRRSRRRRRPPGRRARSRTARRRRRRRRSGSRCRGAIGRRTSSSQVSRCRRRSPASSAPSTSATRRSCGIASASVRVASPARPSTQKPAFCSSTMARERFTSRAIGTTSSAPEAARASAPGLGRGVAVLHHDAGGAEGGGRAQDGADVARVRHLVEQQHRPVRLRDRLVEVERRQRLGQQRAALVDGVLGQEGLEAVAVHDVGLDAPGLRHALGELGLGVRRSAAGGARGGADWPAPRRRRAARAARCCRGRATSRSCGLLGPRARGAGAAAFGRAVGARVVHAAPVAAARRRAFRPAGAGRRSAGGRGALRLRAGRGRAGPGRRGLAARRGAGGRLRRGRRAAALRPRWRGGFAPDAGPRPAGRPSGGREPGGPGRRGGGRCIRPSCAWAPHLPSLAAPAPRAAALTARRAMGLVPRGP